MPRLGQTRRRGVGTALGLLCALTTVPASATTPPTPCVVIRDDRPNAPAAPGLPPGAANDDAADVTRVALQSTYTGTAPGLTAVITVRSMALVTPGGDPMSPGGRDFFVEFSTPRTLAGRQRYPGARVFLEAWFPAGGGVAGIAATPPVYYTLGTVDRQSAPDQSAPDPAWPVDAVTRQPHVAWFTISGSVNQSASQISITAPLTQLLKMGIAYDARLSQIGSVVLRGQSSSITPDWDYATGRIDVETTNVTYKLGSRRC